MRLRREFQRLATPPARSKGVVWGLLVLAAGLLFPFHFNHLFGVLGLGGYTSGLGFPFPTLLHFR